MTNDKFTVNNEILFIKEIVDVQSPIAKELAVALSRRQKTKEFNDFLKESPMDTDNNLLFIEHKISGPHSIVNIATTIKGDIIGVFFLHGFDEGDASLEASARISPNFKGQGVGTALKKIGIQKAFTNREIKKVISWHSCRNKGTFFTNKKCGLHIVDFKENNTFLPNLGLVTDDFKWVIDNDGKILDHIEANNDIVIGGENRDKIMSGLQKHGFLDLNNK